jgi:hypothetical protein
MICLIRINITHIFITLNLCETSCYTMVFLGSFLFQARGFETLMIFPKF